MKTLFLAAMFVVALLAPAYTDTLALWNFNDSDLVVDQGSGTMSLVGLAYNWEDDPTKTDPQDTEGYVSIEVYNWPSQQSPNKTHGLEFSVPTTGKSNIRVRWDMRHNIKNGQSGPNSVVFQYSTDGGVTWNDGPLWVGSGDQWYFNREVDLSDAPNVSNNPNFKFRLMADWEPGKGRYMPCAGSAYGQSRKWRLDLIRVHNDPAPDPGTTIALWDFNDQRDLKADYAVRPASAMLIGGVQLDGDGYSDDFAHAGEPWDSTSSSDPALKGKALDTAGYPAQGQGNRTAGMECRVSTVGCSNLSIEFDVKHKSDSARHIRVLYTPDYSASPVTWIPVDPLFSHVISDGFSTAWWFNDNVVSLAGLPGVDNNPKFAFRIVTEFNPSGSGYAACSTQTSYNQEPYNNKLRFDMIRVAAAHASVSHTPSTITAAKAGPEWQPRSISGAAVTAIHPDYFWVEELARNCGLRVYAPQHNVSVGWQVNLAGVTRLSRDTEKYLYASSVQPQPGGHPVRPLALSNREVGGSDWMFNAADNSGQPGITGCSGLNNIGLLVKTFGIVTAVLYEKDDYPHIEFLYIDDGSGLLDGTRMNPDSTRWDNDDDPELAVPVRGLRVVTTKNFSGDYLGRYVEVVGISSVDKINSVQEARVRAIRRPVVRIIE